MNRGRSTAHVWAHVGTDHCPRCFCLRFSFRCSKHVVGSSSPEERWPFPMRLRNHLYPLAAGLLEPVPLERAYTSEELVVRLTVLLGFVLDQGKFDGAEVIRHLLEAVSVIEVLRRRTTPFERTLPTEPSRPRNRRSASSRPSATCAARWRAAPSRRALSKAKCRAEVLSVGPECSMAVVFCPSSGELLLGAVDSPTRPLPFSVFPLYSLYKEVRSHGQDRTGQLGKEARRHEG